MLRFLLNLSITPLPTKELNELHAAFLTKFVYYSLTNYYIIFGQIKIKSIKETLCCVSYLIVSFTCSPALSKIYVEFDNKTGVQCLLSFPEDRC